MNHPNEQVTHNLNVLFKDKADEKISLLLPIELNDIKVPAYFDT